MCGQLSPLSEIFSLNYTLVITLECDTEYKSSQKLMDRAFAASGRPDPTVRQDSTNLRNRVAATLEFDMPGLQRAIVGKSKSRGRISNA